MSVRPKCTNYIGGSWGMHKVSCLHPKMCHNRCFRFPWGDCIKRRKKLETMVMKNLVGGGGESRKQGAQLWSRRKW